MAKYINKNYMIKTNIIHNDLVLNIKLP